MHPRRPPAQHRVKKLLAEAGRKPGSVPASPRVESFLWTARCRTVLATDSRSDRRGPRRWSFLHDPGLVLLQVGFAVPPSSPRGRCALTAPFHPYRGPGPTAVCFLWHFPSSHLDWPLASTLPFGARTFLDGSFRPAATPTPTSARSAAEYSHNLRAAGGETSSPLANQPAAPSLASVASFIRSSQ